MKNEACTNLLKAALAFLLFTALPCFAQQQQQRDMVKEQTLITQLAAIDTSVVEAFKAGTIAMDELNYPLADSLYSIVYEKAPNFEPVIRRLGTIKTQTGHSSEGITLCEKAVSLNRSADNIIMLVSCLVRPVGMNAEPSSDNLIKAMDLLKEGRTLPGADDYEFTASMGQVALQLQEESEFRDATKELMARHPDKMVSHYFAAIVAATKEEWSTAEDEINEAGALGMSQEDVQKFLDSGVHEKASSINYTNGFLWTLVFWIAGLFLLYLVGMILSGITLRSLESQLSSNTISTKDNKLRTVYRILINIAGVYYYISLPIILILVIVLVGGIIYLCLMAGRIPIQLVAVLVIGGCVTIYGMIRSLVVKANRQDPGRELKEEEAPGLFALTREVASTMGTRAIDEIRITPEVDLAVYEKGSWRERVSDKGKRILILGTGVLRDFKQNDFSAVLAHEYGHFSHRDTAGGDVAMRVRNDMHKYYIALALAGQAVWWNLAFQFLRLYNFIFSRITNGATRLQEILADHVAAETYGAVAFENGLTYVVKRNIEFLRLAQVEIEDAKKTKRAFKNLYELSPGANQTFEEEVKLALNRKTSEDDTHPSPVDRFRFIAGLGFGKGGNESPYVRELFANWDKLTEEMTKQIEESWKRS